MSNKGARRKKATPHLKLVEPASLVPPDQPIVVSVPPSPDPFAAQFAQAVGVGKPKYKKTPGVSNSAFDKWLVDLERVITLKDDSLFDEKHFVALCHKLHGWCYDVDPCWLPLDRSGAHSSAKKMLRVEFAGDAVQMSAYVRWIWRRERKFESFRRANGTHGRVLGWREVLMYRRHLNEYRVECARHTDR